MQHGPTNALLRAAQAGDRSAFDRLFGAHVPKLRGVLRRMVGHPDDVDDLAQQALMRAFEGIDGFRGEASAGTWLCSIGARLAIDHLRARKRWRDRAQMIYAVRCAQSEALGGEVGAAMSRPDYEYDVREHIAYCFTCVGRTLEPEAQAALVLRDVLGLGNDEAARALGVSRSVLRHRLSAARSSMTETYEGLCALVNKQGACWQCSGLREASPEGHRGDPVPEHIDWDERVRLVQEATGVTGKTTPLHDVFFRHTEEQERDRLEADVTKARCGRPDSE